MSSKNMTGSRTATCLTSRSGIFCGFGEKIKRTGKDQKKKKVRGDDKTTMVSKVLVGRR